VQKFTYKTIIYKLTRLRDDRTHNAAAKNRISSKMMKNDFGPLLLYSTHL